MDLIKWNVNPNPKRMKNNAMIVSALARDSTIPHGLITRNAEAIREILLFLKSAYERNQSGKINKAPNNAPGRRVAKTVKPKRATDGIAT